MFDSFECVYCGETDASFFCSYNDDGDAYCDNCTDNAEAEDGYDEFGL